MTNELKPCPFNIGDKVKVKNTTVNDINEGFIIGLNWCYSALDWEVTISPSKEPVGVDYVYLANNIELIEHPLCPETLEAAAKIIENKRDKWYNDVGYLGVPKDKKEYAKIIVSCMDFIAHEIRNLKGEAWHE